MVLNTYLQQEYIEKYIALLYCVSIWDKADIGEITDNVINHVKNLYLNNDAWAYGYKINMIHTYLSLLPKMDTVTSQAVIDVYASYS